MSKLDIINDEITRRQNANVDLNTGNEDIKLAIEQFNKLDEMYRVDEDVARQRLKCLYAEDRHFSDSWPVVYEFSTTEIFPFYGGPSDNQCNPYFPITQAQNGSHDGLAPIEITTSYNGTNLGSGNDGTNFNRVRSYGSVIEPTRRATAMAALAAFPDTSGETGVGSCSGETPPGSGVDETTCLANGGVWTPPGYAPGATATEKLRAALNPWKAEIQAVIADLCEDDGTEEAFWQDLIDNIDIIVDAIPPANDVEYPDNTNDFTPLSPEDVARDYLLAEQANIATHVNNRSTYLQGEAATEETAFAGVIALRLHQANGSYAKQRTAKKQLKTNESIIADNNAAIKSLNVLKVKNS